MNIYSINCLCLFNDKNTVVTRIEFNMGPKGAKEPQPPIKPYNSSFCWGFHTNYDKQVVVIIPNVIIY